MSVMLFGHSLALFIPSFQLVSRIEDGSLSPRMGVWSSDPEKQKRPYSQRIVLSVLTSLGAPSA